MIELLILYLLSKKVLTMYGISKEITANFSTLTIPSYGTISPALKRLKEKGCVNSQKEMSKGGRPSSYFSITKEGILELKKILLEEPLENPLHFTNISRIKLTCANILDITEKQKMIKTLKLKSDKLMYETKSKLDNNDLDFYNRMVYDNLLCEYKNFSTLLDALIKSC